MEITLDHLSKREWGGDHLASPFWCHQALRLSDLEFNGGDCMRFNFNVIFRNYYKKKREETDLV